MLSCIKTPEPVELVGLMEKGGVGLLYGESGLGKTVFAIKHACKHFGNQVALIDFDDNPRVDILDDVEYLHIDGKMLIDRLDDIDIPDGYVMIVDTYRMLEQTAGSVGDVIELLNKSGSNTVIVIAHSKDLATRRDLADVDEVWKNHLDFVWFLDRKTELIDPEDKKSGKAEFAVLVVKKLRGYSGERSIRLRIL